MGDVERPLPKLPSPILEYINRVSSNNGSSKVIPSKQRQQKPNVLTQMCVSELGR